MGSAISKRARQRFPSANQTAVPAMPEFVVRRVWEIFTFFCSRKEICPRRSSWFLVLPAMPWPGVS